MEHSLQGQSCVVQVARNLLEKYSWRIEISLLRPGRAINTLGSAGRSSAPGFSRVQYQNPSARNCSFRGKLVSLLSIKPIHLQFWDRVTQLLSCQITGKTLQGAIIYSKEKQLISMGRAEGIFRGKKRRKRRGGESRCR